MSATPALDIAEGTTIGLPVHSQVVRMLITLALWPPTIQRLPQALVV